MRQSRGLKTLTAQQYLDAQLAYMLEMSNQAASHINYYTAACVHA